MAKFKMKEVIAAGAVTARLGANSGSANWVNDKEIGKLVKLVGDSQYNLCNAGDPIEGAIVSVESYTADDYSIGSVQTTSRLRVTLDGEQADPGAAATLAIGDYVVTGTVVAKGTKLSEPPRVCKATVQPGATAANYGEVGTMIKNAMFGWRIVSLEDTGAVGKFAVIERVSASI